MEHLIVSERWQWNETNNVFIDTASEGMPEYPPCFDIKVAVYEDRVRVWFLNIAKSQITRVNSPSDYVALSIAVAYIEGVQQYHRGENTPYRQSGNWFKESSKRVFPAATIKAIDQLWKRVRCGLFHSGFTNGQTFLSHGYEHAIAFEKNRLLINPVHFINGVIADFDRYLISLRDSKNMDMRRHFEKLWDDRWEKS